MKRRLNTWWFRLPLNRKLRIFTISGALLLLCMVLIFLSYAYYSTKLFTGVLEENERSHTFLQAFEYEQRRFQSFIREPSFENTTLLNSAVEESQKALTNLDLYHPGISKSRYSSIWSLLQSYETYQDKRKAIINMATLEPDYITKLYEVYKIQTYIQIYAKRLVQLTINDTTNLYRRRSQEFSSVLWLTIIGILGLLLAVSALYGVLTKKSITILLEKNRIAKQLHQEEIDRIELRQQLNETQLEMLKSQIDPHFLFNTLNMIAATARKEDAQVSEQMIKALGSMFRYNLKESAQTVLLASEIKNAQDYLYLQNMRFGSRISYTIENSVDQYRAVVPSLLLQPLVENAIIHGLHNTITQGVIIIRIFMRGHTLIVSVYDNGSGISADKLLKIEDAIQKENRTSQSIGIGNIHRRIQRLFPGGGLFLYSKPHIGTCIQAHIPQEVANLQSSHTLHKIQIKGETHGI